MDQLRIAEILRYLSTGFMVVAVAYICEPETMQRQLERLDTLGTTFLVFVVGTLVFHFYRGVFHTWLIFPLKDRLEKGRKNVRNYLREKHPPMNRRQAELFWFVVRSKLPDNVRQGMRNEASAIHILYVAGLCCCAGGFYSLCFGNCLRACVFLVAAVPLGLAALYNDIQFEKLEEMTLRSFGENSLDEDTGTVADLVKRMGFVEGQAKTTRKR